MTGDYFGRAEYPFSARRVLRAELGDRGPGMNTQKPPGRGRDISTQHLLGVAQSGRAPGLEPGGRWFKSFHPDQQRGATMAKGDKISDKQFRAVTEYFDNGFQKEKAMLAAGYSPCHARKHMDRFFRTPVVVAEVKRRLERQAKAVDLNREWILSRFMAIADADATLAKYKVVNPDGSLGWDFTGATEAELKFARSLQVEFYTDGRGEYAREVKKFKIDTSDPLTALTALARIEGMFADRLKLEGDDGVIEELQAGRNRSKPKNEAD